MPKRQLRRSLSLRPESYALVKRVAEKTERSMASVVEECIDILAEAHDVTVDGRLARSEALALAEAREREKEARRLVLLDKMRGAFG